MQNDHDFSTHRLLLTMMKKSEPLSVGDMAKQLNITEMAVRRHLNNMERDGLVETTLVRQPMGRPSNKYSLTAHSENQFPNNYHNLTLDLLEELELGSGEGVINQLFDKRKDKLIGKYASRMPDHQSLQDKVATLTQIQNDNGYMAVWEQDEQGNYVINEFNCPIAQVANKYNHACQSELALFSELLSVEVERVECLAKDGKKCKYVIQNK
ncbi:MAG: metalloregulator ArsR/SmtB family transcription factor [Paenibacillaceae bacterium]